MSTKTVLAQDVYPGDQIQIFVVPKGSTTLTSIAMEVIMRTDGDDEITFVVFNPEAASERKKLRRDPLSTMRVYDNAD